eukprot:scaffold212581_cov15-Tisochrysis_lutea.AAC.1
MTLCCCPLFLHARAQPSHMHSPPTAWLTPSSAQSKCPAHWCHSHATCFHARATSSVHEVLSTPAG